MRLAIVQFDSKLGQVTENIARVDVLLQGKVAPQQLDLLVLPELAFTGYNHTKESIAPLLEFTAAGHSTQWAVRTARRLQCLVTVGYAEKAADLPHAPAFNSQVTVNPSGQVLAHYRKTHLYYTDEGWAQESPTGWLVRALPLNQDPDSADAQTTGVQTAFGICMDLNPYRFTAPWDAYEFLTAALRHNVRLVVLSMAWLTDLPAAELVDSPEDPDIKTLQYWLGRLTPLLENTQQDVVVVCANRCGQEAGPNLPDQLEPGVRYAGTSWIGRFGHGKLRIWNVMGRAEEGILMVDTMEEEVMLEHVQGTRKVS